MAAVDAIEPPEQVTDLHDLLFARYTPVSAALAARARTAPRFAAGAGLLSGVQAGGPGRLGSW